MPADPPTPLAGYGLSCRRENWNDSGPSQIRDISLALSPASLCGISGPDGSGKGLLLNILGLLEPPDAGKIFLDGVPLETRSSEDLLRIRNEACGFLFAHACLLPSFSVAENVAMPIFRISGGDAHTARERTREVLDFVGLDRHEATLAGRLSPADQHRAALARALAHRPRILIAISPPGEAVLLPLAARVAQELGLCVVWAGAKDLLEPYCQRLIEMQDGEIFADHQP